MDAGFDFGRVCVQAVKDYLAEQKITVDNIVILTAFRTQLNRTSTTMSSESKLYVVRTQNNVHNALLFLGSSITESPSA
jgi:hypothetical protein